MYVQWDLDDEKRHCDKSIAEPLGCRKCSDAQISPETLTMWLRTISVIK